MYCQTLTRWEQKGLPRLAVAGVANARVRLREANDRLRAGEMPIVTHSTGYAKRDATAMATLGTTMAAN